MSDTKFTPGPWVPGWIGGKTGPTCPAPLGPTCGGKDWGYLPVGYGMETVAIVVQQDRKGDLNANAHLIAAAPDMYEALKAVNRLIAEGAEHGFNYEAGDWAARLFHSQQRTSNSLKKAEGKS